MAAGLVQVMAASTSMSPRPADCVPKPEAEVAVVCSVTLPPPLRVVSIAVAAAVSMVRLVGSMRHEPPGPASTFASPATATERPGSLDGAARFSGRRRGVESAADLDLACLHAGEQA